MTNRILIISAGLISCSLIAALWWQSRRIDQLTRLVGEPPVVIAGEAAAPSALVARIGELEQQVHALQQAASRVEPRLPRERRGPEPRPLRRPAQEPSAGEEPGAIAAAPAASAPVSEGAVMDAIESADPLIRERFRAVVQEEQDRIFDERMQQRQARAAERGRERVTRLASEVGLSDEQTEWLNTLLDTEREQVGDLFADARRNDLPFPETQAKVRELRATTDAQVKAQLSDKQQAGYDEMRAEERRRFGAPPEPAPAAPAAPARN